MTGLPLQFNSPVSGKVISRAIEWCAFQLNFHTNLNELLWRIHVAFLKYEPALTVPRHSAGLCGLTTALNRIRPKRKLTDQRQEPSKI